MKKALLITLAAALLVSSFASCTNRRDEIKENQTHETETSIETTDGSYADGSFYAGMSQDDFLSLYGEEQFTMKSYREVINTPYYYIFTTGFIPGGQVFNKLTNSMESMCKDPFCDHTDCIFSAEQKSCEEYLVYKDRIYMLVSTQGVGPYYLYSMDLLLQDLRLDFEFPGTLEGQDASGQSGISRGIRECFFYEDAMYCSDIYLDADGIISPTLYKLDLKTKEYGILLEDTYVAVLSMKQYGHILSWLDLDQERVYYDLEAGTYTEDYTPSSFDVEFPEEYKVIKHLLGNGFGYVAVDHTTEMFADDPYYAYYASQKGDKMDKAVRCGGEIYRMEGLDTEDIRLTPIIKLETDGIPDVICWFTTDGETMLVKYETYKDFDNPYNTLQVSFDMLFMGLEVLYTGGPNAKYAIIDLDTGEVIKDIKALNP